MGFFSNSVGLLPRDQARLALQSLNVAFSISARSVSLSRISTLPPLPIFRLPPSGGRWSSNRYPLIKPSLINYTRFSFNAILESARLWRLCYKKVRVHAFIIILRSKPISIQNFESWLTVWSYSPIFRLAAPPPLFKFACSDFGRPETSGVGESLWKSTCSF